MSSNLMIFFTLCCLLASSFICDIRADERAGPGVTLAPTVYRTRTAFLGAIGAGYFEETFDSFTLNADGTPTISDNKNNYQLDGVVHKYLGGDAAFYVCHDTGDRWLQSYNDSSVDFMEFTFSGTLPRSVGAYFFATNYLCTNAINGKIIVELGGVNYTLTASSTSQFLGVKTYTPLTKMRVFGNLLTKNYCITLNDLILADGSTTNPCGNGVVDAGEDCDSANPALHCNQNCHCQSPWFDCNGNPADGCEKDLSDPHSCNTCGNDCFTKGHVVNADCVDGKCVVLECDTNGGTWSDCNVRGFDGCEINLDVNILNCGTCRSPCPGTFPNANATICTAGQCEVFSCIQGFSDCNGLSPDGCEISLFDVHHCGTCGVDCTTKGSHILSTSCGLDSLCHVTSCEPFFSDCDLLAFNGCEVNLLTNVNQCGFCGNACSLPNANPKCANGICQILSCKPGFCNKDKNQSNGCEVAC